MKILGISNDETASACLVINNKVISAVSEERFSRIKMDNNYPFKSIDFVLKNSKISLNDIDFVGYGWNKGFEESKHLILYIDRILEENKRNPNSISKIKERINIEIEQDNKKRKEFENWINENSLRSKVVYFNHHECHALSAIACSPFEESLVVTSDARGDFESMQVGFVGTNNKYEVLYRCPSFDSLGFFYGRITGLLGFTPARHEGKITGLAAHGNHEKHIDFMNKMISYKDGKIHANIGDWYLPFFTNYSLKLKEFISKSKPEDIAAAAQFHLENLITEIVKYYLKLKPCKYICLAGGVFGNVKVNQKIKEIPGVENVFIQPHMSDGGLALGAAVGVPFKLNKKKSSFSSMYLGPKFSNDEILDEIKKNKNLHYEYYDNISNTVVEKIKENKIIGLFQGRMEFGPRALCNRSIIYHCFDKQINTTLNKRLNRTEFMPFAPATAEELASKCFIDWKPNQIASKFMTITYNCTEKMIENSPAVVHIDGTARPQVINKEDNRLMHEILIKWYNKYEGLSLINTSFNKHEEPIVCNPRDAITALQEDQIDILIIENFLIKKY